MKIQTPTAGEISLYFHIPFCNKKCPYCHFFVIGNDLEKQQLLFSALIEEISQKEAILKDKKIISIYFGGGTPYLFKTEFLEKILEKIYTSKALIDSSVEITIEANPEDINNKKVSSLKKIGFNRFSIGVQSLDDHLLKILGRSHTKEQIFKALNAVHECGIENISIDLMYELPQQTIKSWINTLENVKHLHASHISLYNLTFEPNTVFFRKKDKLIPLKPSDEKSKKMLEQAIEKFESLDFKRYEISAFAKFGKYSRHNTGYWLYRPFIGFGPSAFSYLNNQRFQNSCNFKKYIDLVTNKKSSVEFVDEISQSKQIKEAFIISLRLIQGVNITSFEYKWGNISQDIYKAVHKLCQLGYLNHENENIYLTTKGLFFYDTVALEII